MSPYLISDADLAATTDLGRLRRERTLVADAHAASLISDFAEARAAGRGDLMDLIRDHAYAIDPDLVAELDGFDYPAAA
ncbi:hypothetical protein [Streptomyces sp. NPDC057293]|uniref:hypothetical protein n=1 Tax=unclassified Streptomyces TaxID=2593676 RepID=UPI0036396320